jgi:glycosyltransferase involved in cell wall biosynthesis
MKILVLSGCQPHTLAAHEAANTVSYHIVHQLAASHSWKVSYLCINTHEVLWPDVALAQRDTLMGLGVRFLPNLVIRHEKVNGRGLAKLSNILRANPDYLCHGSEHSASLQAHVSAEKPDVVLTVWSEVATAMAHRLPHPVFAYYGNPDPKTAAVIRSLQKLSSGESGPRQLIHAISDRMHAYFFKKAHLRIMSRLAGLVDVAANDALYYAHNGLSDAAYVRNIWGNLCEDWESERDRCEVANPLKIIGNVGNLNATGNTLGLQILCERIVPELRILLGADAFEVHIFGGGRPTNHVACLLDDPNIKVRGFVPDIDGEIISAPVFLVANNWNPHFRVGNTRFLHAWSLGACCVAFRACSDAMPELVHEHNVLLGDSPEQLAAQVARVAHDPEMRRILGRCGYETVSTLFSPQAVVSDLSSWLIANVP